MNKRVLVVALLWHSHYARRAWASYKLLDPWTLPPTEAFARKAWFSFAAFSEAAFNLAGQEPARHAGEAARGGAVCLLPRAAEKTAPCSSDDISFDLLRPP